MTDEVREDLKATAESIALDAERLKQIELRKMRGGTDEAEARELAGEAETLAESIEDKAHIEKDLADRLADGP